MTTADVETTKRRPATARTESNGTLSSELVDAARPTLCMHQR